MVAQFPNPFVVPSPGNGHSVKIWSDRPSSFSEDSCVGSFVVFEREHDRETLKLLEKSKGNAIDPKLELTSHMAEKFNQLGFENDNYALAKAFIALACQPATDFVIKDIDWNCDTYTSRVWLRAVGYTQDAGVKR